MGRLLIGLAAAAVLAACGGKPDCKAKSGYNSCGYCSQDRATSSNPNAGMCTYCSGTCVSECDPCGGGGGGGGSCDASWVSKCWTTSGGFQVTGSAWPQRCGSCPSGTHQVGVDNVTAGGPYYQCGCN